MTIERAKELLWDLLIDLSDKEIEDIINLWKRFVNVVLDHVESKLQKEN